MRKLTSICHSALDAVIGTLGLPRIPNDNRGLRVKPAMTGKNRFMHHYHFSEKNLILHKELGFGGSFRIRTGVNGFADRCLTTRPRNHFQFFASAKIQKNRHSQTFSSFILFLCNDFGISQFLNAVRHSRSVEYFFTRRKHSVWNATKT